MLRKNLIPVWIGILVLSGMFLIGQQTWPPAATTPAPVPKTGQTTSYETGDDGNLQKGVAWPSPRFTDNSDGTVTDNLTGLIWTKNAECFPSPIWPGALLTCNSLATGTCGLTDGSAAGSWRLPNVRELQSLIDYANYNPALPTGHPFVVPPGGWYTYWSSTTDSSVISQALLVNFVNGFLEMGGKADNFDVWCVRGGQ